jgi:hypothetical protein
MRHLLRHILGLPMSDIVALLQGSIKLHLAPSASFHFQEIINMISDTTSEFDDSSSTTLFEGFLDSWNIRLCSVTVRRDNACFAIVVTTSSICRAQRQAYGKIDGSLEGYHLDEVSKSC